jgi:hypothetical protein
MKVASTKLGNAEWEKLVDKCNGRGMNIAEYLRTLIQRDSNDEKVIENTQKNEAPDDSELKQLLESLVKNKNSEKKGRSTDCEIDRTLECVKLHSASKCPLIDDYHCELT